MHDPTEPQSPEVLLNADESTRHKSSHYDIHPHQRESSEGIHSAAQKPLSSSELPSRAPGQVPTVDPMLSPDSEPGMGFRVNQDRPTNVPRAAWPEQTPPSTPGTTQSA